MSSVTSLIRADREYRSAYLTLKEQLAAAKALPLVVNGLSAGAAFAFLAESVRDAVALTGAPTLVLVSDEDEAKKIARALSSAGLRAAAYPSRDLIFHSMAASHDTERERLAVLSSVLSGETDAVVATPAAAMLYTIPASLLTTLTFELRLGDTADPAELEKKLSALGYARVDMVDGIGQYARRGGILDVFVGGESAPVRFEFFGDEIDRMEAFDPVTQRVTGSVGKLSFLPAGETLVSEEARARILATVDRLLAKAKDDDVRQKLEKEKNALENRLPTEFRDKYEGLLYDGQSTLFSYFDLHPRTAVYLLGTAGIRENLKKQSELLRGERETLLSLGLVSAEAARYFADTADFEDFLSRNVAVHLNPFSGGVGTMRVSGLFGFRSRRTVSYGENASLLFEDLTTFRKALYRILIVCENKQGVASLLSSLQENDFPTVDLRGKVDFDYNTMQNGVVYVTVGDLPEGYELMMARVAVLSMAQDEGKRVVAARREARILRRTDGAGERLLSYADLSPGDYVVHRKYGIGRFEGISTVTVDGATRDYITVRYAGTDTLFVPCDRLEMIGKYIGRKDSDGTVKLSQMGGSDWSRKTAKAKSAAKNIAKDLIRLYAERQRRPGYAFPKDSEMEEEFDASFEFAPTDSQLRAIEEIKADMERPVPMNRLLCGDVGFGKTEVALRAAFKAVCGGKQVAFLVPTTILALQHYQTALSRMRGYPVTVEMLSRFRTPKEEEAILRRLRRGEIDILIGTHKLLSKKIEFRDLGLLIIDEEQRFGVTQKEKLREFAKNVDTLILTATPIPRTLNMAMSGISDMSVLDEAPSDRRPVQTYVLEHDDGILAEAMGRELARGGQVLYLYNRIDNIDLVAGRIMKELPEARVAYAHGQMEKEELEDIWQSLVRGELDILVCTTIVETGVDLPNANTLIIENADHMGLSQLHQLRGRVGRGTRQAYAYFTYRMGKALSEIATKRLSTIREYAEFGAGFKIALRDLEIRGAGNLLGAEQHGYIDSVGYDLYIRLLSEAVLEEGGKTPEPPFEATVDMHRDANIPERYIASPAARMEMYKKISLIENEEDYRDVSDEFLDRFGTIPDATARLLRVSLLRAFAARAKIRRVEERGGVLTFSVEKPDLAVWSELFAKYPGLAFRPGGGAVACRLRGTEEGSVLALSVLTDYIAVLSKTEEKEKKQ